jgi:hypothetical protein
MRNFAPRERAEERGAILPLLVVLLVPILILLALVVDLGVILNSSADLEQKTRNAALSGMASFQSEFRYQQSLPPAEAGCAQCNDPATLVYCKYRCAAEAALTRAEQVAAVNLTLGERFATDKSNPIDTFTMRPSNYNGSLSDEGELRVGTYYWIPPAQCPAGGPGIFCPPYTPYFRTLNPNNSAELGLVNAVDLRAGFPSSNMIMAQFARFMGVKSFEVSNHARAAVLPRNDMFLLDLSRSMYRDNYVRDNVVISGSEISGTASEFAVRLKSSFRLNLITAGLGCNTVRLSSQICCYYACLVDPSASICVNCKLDPTCTNQYDSGTSAELIETGSGYSRDYSKYVSLSGSPLPASPAPDEIRHFSDGYRCVSSPNILNQSEYFLVDFKDPSTVSSTFLARPEPLFSVLEATNFAMKTLRERGMTVDKTGIIAFDNALSNLVTNNPRVLTPTTPGQTLFNTYETATNISQAGNMALGFLSKGFFPKPGAYSDIFQALREAAYKISLEPTYQIAKNSITIFTDGLQNCVYTNTGSGEWWERWSRTGGCLNNGPQIISGIENLGDPTFVTELKRRQIAVNMIMFGEDIGAHRVVRKNISGSGCRDQVEDNAAPNPSLPYVDSNWAAYKAMTPVEQTNAFSNATKDAPFLAPNQLYDTLVAPTKGLWLPVLPQLKDLSGNPVIFWNELQSACSGQLTNAPMSNLSLDVEGTTYTGITDAAGRLRYDPLGQSVGDQMKRFMDQIIQSPYVLVP